MAFKVEFANRWRATYIYGYKNRHPFSAPNEIFTKAKIIISTRNEAQQIALLPGGRGICHSFSRG